MVGALSATGKRSLSAYLAQSVLCAPLLAAWGLGLGGELASWSMALFAVGVWLVTVAASYSLERAGRRGPAEALLCRLAYRRPAARGAPEAEEPGNASGRHGDRRTAGVPGPDPGGADPAAPDTSAQKGACRSVSGTPS